MGKRNRHSGTIGRKGKQLSALILTGDERLKLTLVVYYFLLLVSTVRAGLTELCLRLRVHCVQKKTPTHISFHISMIDV